jgi:hypothetical protein
MSRICFYCGKELKLFEGTKVQTPNYKTKVKLCPTCSNIETNERLLRETILKRIYPVKIKQLCREVSIPTEEKRKKLTHSKRKGTYFKNYTYKFKYEELVDILKYRVPRDYLLDYTKRNGIPVNDIILKIQQQKDQQIVKTLDQQDGQQDQLLNEVLKAIYSFQPLMSYYDSELPYHVDLGRWLKDRFTDTKIEFQVSSARPDIAIGGIAIEVKGPTTARDLDTIASKCLRYSQYFKRGLIIVLFNLNVSNNYYNDWIKGVKQTYPYVKIISK